MVARLSVLAPVVAHHVSPPSFLATSRRFTVLHGTRFVEKNCLRGNVGGIGDPIFDIKLLDHVVGRREQRFWDRDAEGLSGFKINHKFKLRGLHNGQIGRICAF
jgi:hypothetical protein